MGLDVLTMDQISRDQPDVKSLFLRGTTGTGNFGINLPLSFMLYMVK